MTLETRHLFGAVVIAMAAHIAVVGWFGRYTPASPVGGGYSVMRVRLGEMRALPAAEPAPAPEVAPRPPEPQPPPDPPKVEVAKPESPKPKPPVRKVADVPKPKPREPRAQPTPEVASQVAAEAGAVAPPPAVSGVPDGQVTGAPTGAAAAGETIPGDPGLPPAYVGQVRSWLERHRTYPLAARRQRIEGRALLWFRIDRRGKVLAYRIEESSGHGMLDRAVEQMIERASPLPRVPSEYPVDEPEFLIPIDFRLR